MTAAATEAAAVAGSVQMQLVELPVGAIAEHPDNPRRELKKVDELAASMDTNGLLQPVVVVPMEAFLAARPDDGVRIQAPGCDYVVVIGHRRCAGAVQLGWETIWAIVRPDLASAQAAGRTFIVENLQRVDLDPMEEAHGYADLARMGLSQRQIADECGKSQPHVSKRLALLQLPEDAQEQASQGRIKLTAVRLRSGSRCVVESGTLADPYTGRRIAFRKQQASKVQIDHIYPLARAWDLGAAAWTVQRRAAFANDRAANLLAVDGATNASKGDDGPGEWLPVAAGYRCTYVLRYLQVARTYQLAITAADRDAARTITHTCSGKETVR